MAAVDNLLMIALHISFVLPMFMSIGVPNYTKPDYKLCLDPVGVALTTCHDVSVKNFGLQKLHASLVPGRCPDVGAVPRQRKRTRRCLPGGFEARSVGSYCVLFLLMSGDVSLNPGPPRVWKHPCLACHKPVKANQTGLQCDLCDGWTHLRCVPDAIRISLDEYNRLAQTDENWYCYHCQIPPLSESFFSNESDTEPDHPDDPVDEDTNYLEDLVRLRRKHPKNIIIAHLNINSMKTKYIMATDILHQKLVDILVIGESKIDGSYSDAIFHVEGYGIPYRNDRTTRGGGIMAYVNCDIPSRRLVRTEPDTIEAIHLELQIGEHKWLMMANYRPPAQSAKSYIDNATKALDVAFINFENVILLGDLNFDMLIKEKSAPLTELCDIFDLKNLVKGPTCFTKNSAPSSVDVILTNKPRTFNGTLTCDTGLSDVHHLVACVMKNMVKPKQKGKTMYRSFKNLDESALLRDIESAPLHVAEIFDDIDDVCWMHEKLLSEIIDEHIPVKERKQKPAKAPYMNGELRKEINHKKKLRRTFENSRTTKKKKVPTATLR